MRTDYEMFGAILSFAGENDEIRAVYMNGSRANPQVAPDCWQDFDIVYVVNRIDPFIKNQSWIRRFGEIAVMQEPDSDLFEEEHHPSERYAFLMQFTDGNRIDLTFQSISQCQEQYGSDPLTVPLLDKDGLLKALPSPTDEIYHVRRPSQRQYEACCNELRWVAPYMAKGLCRGELLFAVEHLERYIRPQYLRMLEYLAGFRTDFSVSVGKIGKYLQRYIPEEDWKSLADTYPRLETEEMWRALFLLLDGFERAARTVAGLGGFLYNQKEADSVRTYLERVYRGEIRQVDLQAGDCRIRSLGPEDKGLLLKWLTDPRVLEFYEGRDTKATPQWIQDHFYAGDEPEMRRCLLKYKGRPMGYMQMYPLTVQEAAEEYQYEGGDRIFAMDQFSGEPDCWGKGIGRKLISLALGYLVHSLGARTVLLDPHVGNERAVRCYEHCGFQKIRLLKKHEKHEGVMVDCWLMSYKPEEEHAVSKNH